MLLLGGFAWQHVEQIGAADQLFQATHAQLGQPLAGFFGDEGEEVHHHFDGADEVILAQFFVLRGYTGRTVVQVADTQELAAQGDHGCGAEAEALGAEDRGLDHVQAGFQAAVSLHPDLAAQVIAAQGLVSLGQAELPRCARILDRADRRSTGTTVVTGDGDQVGVSLGHASGDGANARFRNQLDRHQRLGIDLLEVKNQLRQVFNRVDVVVRRRRNQGHARHGITQTRNQAVDLATG